MLHLSISKRKQALTINILSMAIRVYTGTAKPTQTERQTTYRDLHLDLSEEDSPRSTSLFGSTTKTDLRTSIDEGAILNSLKNIFTTTPGEKLLNPTFGLSLYQWLFQPADEFTAREIGEAIVEGIERYEPRVIIKNVNVKVQEEDNQYTIELVLTIPTLSIVNKTYTAILEQPGFDFLTNTPS